MTVITSKKVIQEESQGSIVFKTNDTTRMTITHGGAINFAADGKTLATINGSVGGQATITSASASTDSASALSSFQIAHGLAATPTVFLAVPASSAAALASLLGAYVTADATYVRYNTVASVTASKAYAFDWFAQP